MDEIKTLGIIRIILIMTRVTDKSCNALLLIYTRF